MGVYIGCDYHPQQQTLAWMDTEDGVIRFSVLKDQRPEQVREFLRQFPGGTMIGMEATGACDWFERVVAEAGHVLLVGDAKKIRKMAPSRHKTDRRDAEHLLTLLLQDRFPALWRRPLESQLVLEQLRFRHGLVKQRTFVSNRLQVLARGLGLPQLKIRSKGGRQLLTAAPLDPTREQIRTAWFTVLDQLEEQVAAIELLLKQRAEAEPAVARLSTHPGIGPLTALCYVHTMGDVSRFQSTRQITGFLGLDPVEDSSSDTRRIGHISKEGSTLLRFLLGQAAQTVINRHGDEKLRQFYQPISRRRGRPIAKVATARKLGIRAYIMLRDEIDYAEFDRRGRAVGLHGPPRKPGSV
jgi:transposase